MKWSMVCKVRKIMYVVVLQNIATECISSLLPFTVGEAVSHESEIHACRTKDKPESPVTNRLCADCNITA